jgi:hypothetical protein
VKKLMMARNEKGGKKSKFQFFSTLYILNFSS